MVLVKGLYPCKINETSTRENNKISKIRDERGTLLSISVKIIGSDLIIIIGYCSNGYGK